MQPAITLATSPAGSPDGIDDPGDGPQSQRCKGQEQVPRPTGSWPQRQDLFAAMIAELAGFLLRGDLNQSLENLAGPQPLFSSENAKHKNDHSTIGETAG